MRILCQKMLNRFRNRNFASWLSTDVRTAAPLRDAVHVTQEHEIGVTRLQTDPGVTGCKQG
jgi:hypothetical protein